MHYHKPIAPTFTLVRIDGVRTRFSAHALTWKILQRYGVWSREYLVTDFSRIRSCLAWDARVAGVSLAEYLSKRTHRYRFMLFDHDGFVVDPESLPAPASNVHWYYKPHVFRSGPVWGIRCYKPSKRYYRTPSTAQVHRDADWANHDPDLLEHGIRERPKRKRVPTDRDDLYARPQKCWKEQRRTRWR